MIAIVDFGSQTSHLISRRLRELGCEARLVDPEDFLSELPKMSLRGIILSGGPKSVYQKGAPHIDKKVADLGLPILGICYGHQLLAYLLGGTVHPGKKKEYGPATVTVTHDAPLLKQTAQQFNVWMNHGDEVVSVPPGFKGIAKSETIQHAAMADEQRKIYSVQFHPEVVHTQFGEQILKNFLGICNVPIKEQKIDKEFVNSLIEDIRESVKEGNAISAISGGVDSSISTLLVHEALGKRLTAIYVDSGLMRLNETKLLQETFESHYRMKVKVVNARSLFLKNLKGVTDPEKKRKVIGNTFIKVLEREAKKVHAKYLVQGTIYPDVIESAGTKHSSKIKSHHNVGGLPKNMKLALIEPLRTFYKDEVRVIGSLLQLPEEIVHRHAFPGPGLGIRIIGEVTEKKLNILRRADAILREEIENAKLPYKLWQTHAVFTGVKSTGVRGDERVYGETIALAAIVAKDAMSAHWARLPYDLLDTISTRIVNEVPEVNRVVFDITNKPPATMEWE
jgi:GMP synthase (glutamine-hydrolysing)